MRCDQMKKGVYYICYKLNFAPVIWLSYFMIKFLWYQQWKCYNASCRDLMFIVCVILMFIHILLGTDHLTWRGGYGFLFRSEIFFRTTQELEYLFFLSRKARNFFPEFNIMLYDKNSESYYFFSSTKIRIFFSATLGIRIFF